MNINTVGWGAFGTDPCDAICEAERRAATDHTLRRLKKASRTGADQPAIAVGMVMALTQLAFAMADNAPTDDMRDALHEMVDYAWLQCLMHPAGKRVLS